VGQAQRDIIVDLRRTGGEHKGPMSLPVPHQGAGDNQRALARARMRRLNSHEAVLPPDACAVEVRNGAACSNAPRARPLLNSSSERPPRVWQGPFRRSMHTLRSPDSTRPGTDLIFLTVVSCGRWTTA
jgi:hypothetical protein